MGQGAKQTRENRTITVDFQNEATYFQLLDNGKAFLECVLAFVLSLGFRLLPIGVLDTPDVICSINHPDCRPICRMYCRAQGCRPSCNDAY